LAGTTKNDSKMHENLKSGICGTLLLCSYVCVPCTHIVTQLFLILSDNFLISTDSSEIEIRIWNSYLCVYPFLSSLYV